MISDKLPCIAEAEKAKILMKKEFLLRNILKRIEKIIDKKITPVDKLGEFCNLLHSRITLYNWVGFYIVERPGKQELILGPFTGENTIHVRIPFGIGICGRVASIGKPYMTENVTGESNYLSCSLSVKSELVVPVLFGGKLIGVIDIDSHSPEAFNHKDLLFLERAAEMVTETVYQLTGKECCE